MKRILKCVIGSTLAVAGTKAMAVDPDQRQVPPPSHPLPPYKLERWDEDYSYLKTGPSSDPFDAIKYIPLSSDGDFYVTFGGEVRDRYEYFNHNNFGAGPQTEHGYNLARVNLDADVHLTKYFRVFVEGRGAYENGREGGPRLPDLDQADIQQGFGDVILPLGEKSSFTFRAGRQELVYGAERLIGPADWLNVRRTFDGFRAMLVTGDNTLEGFWTRPVQIQKYDFDSANNHVLFGGIYDTLQLPAVLEGAKTKLEGYVLYLKNDAATFPGVTGVAEENRYTGGARISSNPKPFDFDVEGDYQWGSFHGEDIRAWSIASEGGYTLENVSFTPRLFVGFDAASGDRHANDGKLETFNQLFPTGHTYFGYIDVIGRQNIVDLHGGAEAILCQNHQWAQRVGLRAEYHQFWRESDSDALFQASGAPIRPTGTSNASNVGSEIDLLLRWQIDRHLGTYFGYSHFFHGKFIQETGAAKDIDFAYAAVTFTF